MLFAAITSAKEVDNVELNFDSFPTYSVANAKGFFTRLTRGPKVVSPLSDRFEEEEICLKYDLVVELKADKRYVTINQEDDSEAQEHMCNYGNNVSLSKANEPVKLPRPNSVENSKSVLKQLSVTKANSLQTDRMTAALSSADEADVPKVSDANFAKPHPPAENVEHRVVKIQKRKRSDMEETWKLLDSALQNVKGKSRSSEEKCSDNALGKSVAKGSTKVISLTQVPDIESQPTDPRLLQSRQPRRDKQAELDLPLPKFAEILTEMQTQSTIDVVIGVGKEVEVVADDQCGEARICLMESLKRQISQLDVLSNSEFGQIADQLKAFQQTIAEAVSMHHSCCADY